MSYAIATFARQRYRSLSPFHEFKRHYNKVPVQSIQDLSSKWKTIREDFHRNGYVVLSPGDDLCVSKISRLFGNIQNHPKARSNGIVHVVSADSAEGFGQIRSSDPFFLHTDGAYLDGIAKCSNKTRRITPPRIVLLKCVHPSLRGGETMIVDGQKILTDLLKTHGVMLSCLFNGKDTAFCHGSLLAMNAPIFDQKDKRSYSIRYSHDKEFFCPINLSKIFQIFNDKYVNNPKYQQMIKLNSRDIIVFDNQRVLHGRTAFVGRRVYERVWVENTPLVPMESAQKTGPFYSSVKHPLVSLEVYQKYGTLLEKKSDLHPIATGITLSTSQEASLRKDLSV